MPRAVSKTAAITAVTAMWMSVAAVAQDRVEVRAAIEAARADLRGQILSLPVAPGVSIRQLIEKDAVAGKLDDLIGSAERVGQPRWVEQDIVQVKMSLSAAKVVDLVSAIPPKERDPRVTQTDVDRLHREWSRRSLQGTGQGIPAARVAEMVSAASPITWREVPLEARRDAATRARTAASTSLVDQAVAIRTGAGETVSDHLAGPDSRQKLATWASALPATRVLLRDDRQVEIAVYVDKQGLGEQVRSVSATPLTSQADKVQALELGISRLPNIVVGRASAAPEIESKRPAVVLRGAPAWANDPITAEATATSVGNSRLRTARAAEQKARDALQKRVQQLKLDAQTTLEQAGASDARVTDAVTRAMGRARTYQVDYNADGSATVRVSLDPNDLIDELTVSR